MKIDQPNTTHTNSQKNDNYTGQMNSLNMLQSAKKPIIAPPWCVIPKLLHCNWDDSPI